MYRDVVVAILFAAFLTFMGFDVVRASSQAEAAITPHAVALACDTSQHHQFDFWLGDWQVLDSSTGKLIGFDRVEKQLKGCAVVENLVFLSDDQWRRPEMGYRVSGISVSVFQEDHWLML